MKDIHRIFNRVAVAAEVELMGIDTLGDNYVAAYRRYDNLGIQQYFGKDKFERLDEDQLVAILVNDLNWRMDLAERNA